MAKPTDARLSEALRANLKRRKLGRAQSPAPGAATEASAADEGHVDVQEKSRRNTAEKTG